MYEGKLYGKMTGVGWEVKGSFKQRKKRKVIWQDGRGRMGGERLGQT